MIYIIQVVAYTGLMLLVYLLLLRDRPLHRFNRVYLLASVVVAAILPFIKWPQFIQQKMSSEPVLNFRIPEIVISSEVKNDPWGPVSWLGIALLCYVLVVLLIAGVQLWRYSRLRTVIRNADQEHRAGYILLRNTGYGPGSWGKYVFIPGEDAEEAILVHEYAHTRLRHTWDIVFINIALALFWPNMFLYLLKKELVQVHEFQADAAVDMEQEAYSRLLLSSLFGTCNLPLTHSFIFHPINRRIKMLYKNNSPRRLNMMLALALLAIVSATVISIQSCKEKTFEMKKVSATHEKDLGSDSALSIIHQMPEPGYNLGELLGNNIKYPEEAKEKGIEGKVIIKFIVDKKGHLRNIQPAENDYDPLLADAAIKAVAALPDWMPGKNEHGEAVAVWYSLPVVFKLGDDHKMSWQKLEEMPAGVKKAIYSLIHERMVKEGMVAGYTRSDEELYKTVEDNKEEFHKKLEEMKSDPEKNKEREQLLTEAHRIMTEYDGRKK